MKWVCMIFCFSFFIAPKVANGQMGAQTLIPLLNFSKTLIQDAEITFLWYEKYPTHPDNVGRIQQKILAFREQELSDVHKAPNPSILRRAILSSIEELKMYGEFRDADENFFFQEVNLVFQVVPNSTGRNSQVDYRMEQISRFENYPSIGFKRYFNGGHQEFLLANAERGLSGYLPNQFATDNRIGDVSPHSPEDNLWRISFPCWFPPVFIDETKAEMDLSESDGEDVYVITHFPFQKVMGKVYVRVTGLPRVIREELYYQSASPNLNEEGYWLRTVAEYNQFELIEGLNLAYPKVCEEKEYRADGFLRRIEIITIKEMAFNQGLPPNFFDWNTMEVGLK